MNRIIGWLALAIALGAILPGSMLPGSLAWVAAIPGVLTNVVHVFAYALLVYGVLVICGPGTRLSRRTLCLVVVALAVVVGIVMEFGQIEVDRDSNLLDVGLDFAGAVIGALGWLRVGQPAAQPHSKDAR